MDLANNNNNVSNVDGNLTSGSNISFWIKTISEPIVFTTLDQDIITDVLVIGGGISGLTTAYCLIKEGFSVVLVEDGYIGSGETGRTTAHISCALDDHYYELEKTFDERTARLAANSHTAAIKWIENTVKRHNIDCNFKRVDGYLFLHPTDNIETLQKEIDATHRAGLKTEMLQSIPYISGEAGKSCIKFPEQAQFHVMHYLKGLADAFVDAGGKIFTQSRAKDITDKGATVNGYTISAEHIVVATNTPINDLTVMHTKQWPYRTYVIGCKIPKGEIPFALWWDSGDQKSKWISKPYHYIRLEEFDETSDVLIVGGEDHRTGQAEEENLSESARYDRLFEWAKVHFPIVKSVDFKWSGQVMEPIDSLAFLGRNPGDENIYIVTGDSGNGITHGTLGGIIITDLIKGRDSHWIDIYNPSRITIKTTLDYLHEVGKMAVQYGDWISIEEIKELDQLQKGEGGIIAIGLKKVAAYCDENGIVHVCTAICPHMGGILQWNPDEKSFDCPLHGSRFTKYGKVINGPASSNLKVIDVKDQEDISVV